MISNNLCKLCKHRHGFGCTAYPDKIPLEIRLMRVDHREPYTGDHGILFEPKDDTPETLARLTEIKVQKGRIPAGPNALDHRLAKVYRFLRFADTVEHTRFMRQVVRANTFSELPVWCQELILKAEEQLAG
jgi:hypothetical protein